MRATLNLFLLSAVLRALGWFSRRRRGPLGTEQKVVVRQQLIRFLLLLLE